MGTESELPNGIMRLTAKVIIDTRKLDRFRELCSKGLAHPGVSEIDEMFRDWARLYERWALKRFQAASQGDGTWAQLAMSTLLARRKGTAQKHFTLKGRAAAVGNGLMAFYRGEYKAAKNHLQALTFARLGSGASSPREQKRVKSLARAHAQNAVNNVAKGLGRAGIMTRRETVASLQNEMGYVAFASILNDTGQLFEAMSIGSRGNISERRGASMVFGIGGPAEHKPSRAGGPTTTIGKIAAYHQNGGSIPGRPPQRQIVVVPPQGDAFYTKCIEKFNRATKTLLG